LTDSIHDQSPAKLDEFISSMDEQMALCSTYLADTTREQQELVEKIENLTAKKKIYQSTINQAKRGLSSLESKGLVKRKKMDDVLIDDWIEEISNSTNRTPIRERGGKARVKTDLPDSGDDENEDDIKVNK
jgi:phage shock protein A